MQSHVPQGTFYPRFTRFHQNTESNVRTNAQQQMTQERRHASIPASRGAKLVALRNIVAGIGGATAHRKATICATFGLNIMRCLSRSIGSKGSKSQVVNWVNRNNIRGFRPHAAGG